MIFGIRKSKKIWKNSPSKKIADAIVESPKTIVEKKKRSKGIGCPNCKGGDE